MKVSQVTIVAGAGYTDVPCTIGAHRMEIFDKSDTKKQLDFKQTEDSFATATSTTPILGNVIKLQGRGLMGILGRPINYSAVGHPAASEVIAKVRTTDASGCVVTVHEYEL